jgi:hypothetical protein
MMIRTEKQPTMFVQRRPEQFNQSPPPINNRSNYHQLPPVS